MVSLWRSGGGERGGEGTVREITAMQAIRGTDIVSAAGGDALVGMTRYCWVGEMREVRLLKAEKRLPGGLLEKVG